MVSFNPADARIIKVTPDEQMALLKYCPHIDDDIRSVLFSSQDGTLTLTSQQCNELRHAISIELDRAGNDKTADALGKVYNKLSPNPAIQGIAEKLSSMSFEDIEQLQAAADKVMQEHNDAPDSALGGLTPNQTRKLLHTPWDREDCPIKFNKHLPLADVNRSQYFRNARIFLNAILELKDEKNVTAKGNLSRKAVKIMFDRFEFEEEFREYTLRYNKVLNETDVYPVHLARILCEGAGLIKRKAGRFFVVKKYMDMVSDEKAGELYYQLFSTYFTRFNIAYRDCLPDADSIQATAAYTFYRLSKIADTQVNMQGLAPKIFLPTVMKEINEQVKSRYIKTEWLIRARIIEPLEGFGLIECFREKYKSHTEIEKIKKTALFDKFMRFEI